MSPSSFREVSRARCTTFLKALEDMKALQLEFNALGGASYIPADADPIWTGYDMTRSQYLAMLTAMGQMLTAFDGTTLSASSTRQGDLYKGKV